jgi:hypothetical protein
MALPKRTPRGSEPPSFWVAVFVVIVVGTPILASVLGFFSIDWRSLLPWGHSDNWYIVAIFAPLPLLLVVALLAKVFEERRAAKWAQAPGRIVKSGIGSRDHRFAGEAATVRNIPVVAYTFSVGGREYRGDRIVLGEVGAGEIDAMLAKYPAGKEVTVFYDPADPNNCVLEHGIPSYVFSGCLWLTAIAIAGIAGFYYAATNATKLLALRLPPQGNPEATIAFAAFGLVILLFFAGYRHYLKRARNWPSVRGSVVRSEVETYTKREDGRDRTQYSPLVEYIYRVSDREYRSRQIRFSMTVRGSEAFARKEAARYPVGAEVVVHYDPDNFSNAALEGPGGYPWVMLAAAAFCFAAAIFASGIFR